MKDFLEGKPFKAPIHPAIVHFPIALFFASFLFDIASLAFSYGGMVQASFYSIALGVLMALIAAIPGFVDYTDIRNDHPAKKVATAHMILNLLAVALYGASLGVRYASLNAPRVEWLPFILGCIGIGLISISGYLGGMMVYDDGISVGRHRRKTETPEHTIHVSRENEHENFVPVAAVDSIHHGETLRVDFEGTLIVIAKWEGRFYAVQEFCTHRFGPLSEGCIHDAHIECPWHCSCFDLRTGKVTRGPAKVDLKTFPVEVRDGKICIALTAEMQKEQNFTYIKKPEPRTRFTERFHRRFDHDK